MMNSGISVCIYQFYSSVHSYKFSLIQAGTSFIVFIRGSDIPTMHEATSWMVQASHPDIVSDFIFHEGSTSDADLSSSLESLLAWWSSLL